MSRGKFVLDQISYKTAFSNLLDFTITKYDICN